jgi:hypothetical protein
MPWFQIADFDFLYPGPPTETTPLPFSTFLVRAWRVSLTEYDID